MDGKRVGYGCKIGIVCKNEKLMKLGSRSNIARASISYEYTLTSFVGGVDGPKVVDAVEVAASCSEIKLYCAAVSQLNDSQPAKFNVGLGTGLVEGNAPVWWLDGSVVVMEG